MDTDTKLRVATVGLLVVVCGLLVVVVVRGPGKVVVPAPVVNVAPAPVVVPAAVAAPVVPAMTQEQINIQHLANLETIAVSVGDDQKTLFDENASLQTWGEKNTLTQEQIDTIVNNKKLLIVIQAKLDFAIKKANEVYRTLGFTGLDKH